MNRIATSLSVLLGFAWATAAEGPVATGAELFSQNVAKYGRWEVRMRAAAAPGTVSAFYLYYLRSHEGHGEPWRELDIQVLGKSPRSFQSNPITGTADQRTTTPRIHDTKEDLSKTFHTYALEWTPDSIVWELDGKRIRKVQADSQVVALRSQPMSWRMNLWVSAWPEWTGRFQAKDLPICQYVNWVRFLRYTPGKGPDGSNWTEDRVEDFNSLEPVRWGKASWSFPGNNSPFSPANIGIHDGMAALSLTARGQEGTTCALADGAYPKDPLGATFPGAGKGFTLR